MSRLRSGREVHQRQTKRVLQSNQGLKVAEAVVGVESSIVVLQELIYLLAPVSNFSRTRRTDVQNYSLVMLRKVICEVNDITGETAFTTDSNVTESDGLLSGRLNDEVLGEGTMKVAHLASLF